MRKYDKIRERVSAIQDEVEARIEELVESHGPVEIPEGRGLIINNFCLQKLFVRRVDTIGGNVRALNEDGENLLGWGSEATVHTMIDLAEAVEKYAK